MRIAQKNIILIYKIHCLSPNSCIKKIIQYLAKKVNKLYVNLKKSESVLIQIQDTLETFLFD